MSLKTQLVDDLKTAMKSRNEAALSAIRLLKAEITKMEIQVGRDIDDVEICKLVEKALKQRRESIEIYQKAGRDDLVAKETAELEILSQYQPAQLTEDELKAVVESAIAEVGATGMKQMGAVIKASMAKVGARADGKSVSDLVKKCLAAL